MLLRPILLHVARYSEYISDRDTEPSGFVSKCAFSLLEKQTTDKVVTKQAKKKMLTDTKDLKGIQVQGKSKIWFLTLSEFTPLGELILPLQCKFFPI